MSDWAQIEHVATQHLVGALVGKYGAAMSEITEEQARVLACVALVAVRSDLQQAERERDEWKKTAEIASEKLVVALEERDKHKAALKEIANLFDDDDAGVRAKEIARRALAEKS